MNKTFFTTPSENLPSEGQEIIFKLKDSIPVLSGYENQNEITGKYKFGVFLTKDSKSERAVLNGIDTFLWMNETGLVTFPAESVEKWIGKEVIEFSDEIGNIISPTGVSMFSDTEDSEEKELKKIKVDQVKKRPLKFYLLVALKVINSFFSIPVNLSLAVIYFIRFLFLVLPKKIKSVIIIKKQKKIKIAVQKTYNDEFEKLSLIKVELTKDGIRGRVINENRWIEAELKEKELKSLLNTIQIIDTGIQERKKDLNFINSIISYHYKIAWSSKKVFKITFFTLNLLYWVWYFDLINYLSVLN